MSEIAVAEFGELRDRLQELSTRFEELRGRL
jgi:hypothetical protein